MNEFARQIFAPDYPLQVSARAIRRNPFYANYLTTASPSSVFDVPQLLAVFRAVLSERLLLIFLQENADITINVISKILHDHLREAGREPKDLQLNLVSNLVVQITREQDLPVASRYGFGEGILRKCQFDPAFKLCVKQALFDRKTIENVCLTIHPYREKW